MKIHAFTSIFGISQAAFYGNHYNQYIPRPGPIGYMPMHPGTVHRPGPGMVPSKPVPAEAKRQVHQGALCGEITNFK